MERLTYDFCFNGVHCNQVKGADNSQCSEVCEREDSCNECPIAKAFDRLAAIEDILGDGYNLDRLRELIQADREEKRLILPCKVGDTVYKFDASICKYRDKDKCDEYCDGFQYRDCWEGSQIVAATNFELKMLWSFGKTVFPTREEAEAALEKMKGGTHGNK